MSYSSLVIAKKDSWSSDTDSSNDESSFPFEKLEEKNFVDYVCGLASTPHASGKTILSHCQTTTTGQRYAYLIKRVPCDVWKRWDPLFDGPDVVVECQVCIVHEDADFLHPPPRVIA